MFNFLGCLFVFLLGGFFIVAALVGNILDFILTSLGLKRRVTRNGGYGFGQQAGPFGQQANPFGQQGQDQQDSFRQGEQQTRSNTQSAGQQTRKIFTKDESEYVDFEEV